MQRMEPKSPAASRPVRRTSTVQRRAQARPEGAGEARAAVRGEHAGQPRAAEHRRDQAARRSRSGGGLEGRDQPQAPGQEVDLHLQIRAKVVAGGSERATGSSRLMYPPRRVGTGRACRWHSGRWLGVTR